MPEKIKMNAFNALPTVYTEALSYYETLCKAVAAVNECIDLVNSLDFEDAGYIKLIDREDAPTGADIYKDIDGKIHIVNSLIAEQGLDANNRQIRNVRTPVNGNDATNKDYVDSAVAAGGGESAGYIKLADNEVAPDDADIYKDTNSKVHIVDSLIAEQGIDANSNFIRNVRTPVNGNDATNKDYVDSAVAAGGELPDSVGIDLSVYDGGTYHNVTVTSAILYPTSNMIVVKGRGAFISSPANGNYINVSSTELVGEYSIIYGVFQSENSGSPKGTIIGNGVVTEIDPPGVDLYNLTNTAVGSSGTNAEFTLTLFVTKV